MRVLLPEGRGPAFASSKDGSGQRQGGDEDLRHKGAAIGVRRLRSFHHLASLRLILFTIFFHHDSSGVQGASFPGISSTPLHTSTAKGLTVRIASSTLDGPSPPDKIIGNPASFA